MRVNTTKSTYTFNSVEQLHSSYWTSSLCDVNQEELSYIMSGVKFCWWPQWSSVQIFSKESSWTYLDKLSFHCRWTDVIRYINKIVTNLFAFCFSTVNQMGPDARKPVFGGLRTTQAQTSLRICAVWSAPLLFPFWKLSYVNLMQVKFQFSW